MCLLDCAGAYGVLFIQVVTCSGRSGYCRLGDTCDAVSFERRLFVQEKDGSEISY